MSVVGYDFGNSNSLIAVARHGGIDVLCNDFSLRATPTCVAFGRKSRLMGVAARQQVNTNLQNTVINFKHLLGRKYSDPIVQLYKKFIPCEMVQTENDGIGLKVNFLGEVKVLSPEQVAAAFFVKLKQITEHELGTKIKECMLSVPIYFSEPQVNALKAAGQIAGLNVLNLVKENEAVGVAYGLYKNASLPVEPNKMVVIVDVGYSSVQASLMRFSSKQVEILCSCYDVEVGGLFFDDVIRDHFYVDFLKRFKVDAKKNPKAWLRLLDESEKVKKQMSASTMHIPLSIECFMDDTDVSGTINRDQFELSANLLFERLCRMLDSFLNNVNRMGYKIEDVSEVELIGGSSRIPKLKQIIGDYFGGETKSTMDVEESVARGVAMHCAIVSPTTRVKEFKVIKEMKQLTQSSTEDVFSLNIEECIKSEKEMQAVDLGEKEKADTKNALEEYCYSMVEKLSGSLEMFVSQEENVQFCSLISGATDWLYCDGIDASGADYVDKLSFLQGEIDSVIQKRQDALEKQQSEEFEKERRRAMEEKYRQEQATARKDNGGAKQEKTVKEPSKNQDAASSEPPKQTADAGGDENMQTEG